MHRRRIVVTAGLVGALLLQAELTAPDAALKSWTHVAGTCVGGVAACGLATLAVLGVGVALQEAQNRLGLMWVRDTQRRARSWRMSDESSDDEQEERRWLLEDDSLSSSSSDAEEEPEEETKPAKEPDMGSSVSEPRL